MEKGKMDRRDIGLRLHQAEVSIGLGRRALQALRSQIPMDPEAIAAKRADIDEARQRRNDLRQDLEEYRIEASAGRPQTVWARGR